MIKFENTTVMNFENALRGMRNPLNSWDKIDSIYCLPNMCLTCKKCNADENNDIDWIPYQIGENDLNLAIKLIKAGSEHRKFLRQILVSVDITAPRYWWTEFDTYKVGTVANSCSTMHKIHSKEFGTDDFSYENMSKGGLESLSVTIDVLNTARRFYLRTKDKKYWYDMIKLLPQSYNQKRTVTMNYENLLNMCSKGQRRFHKLDDWSIDFINWTRTLPYAQQMIFIDELE